MNENGWVRILPIIDVPTGADFIIPVKTENKKICLIKFEGKYSATQSKCPHAGADLSNGFCKNGKLICPYHRYSYDLQTGKGDPGQGDYINTYPVEVREDGIYLKLSEKWKFWKKLFRRK